MSPKRTLMAPRDLQRLPLGVAIRAGIEPVHYGGFPSDGSPVPKKPTIEERLSETPLHSNRHFHHRWFRHGPRRECGRGGRPSARFLKASTFSGYTAQQKADINAYMISFDTGTAPAVGYSRTLTKNNVTNAASVTDWALLQSQAAIAKHRPGSKRNAQRAGTRTAVSTLGR